MTTPPREAGLSSAVPQLPSREDAADVPLGALRRRESWQPRLSSYGRSVHALRRRRRVQLVVNPRSGHGVAVSLGQRLACHLRTDRYDAQLMSAEDLPEARARLLQTGRDLHCLIAVGGDHTLSEMAAVAVELRVPLLPVPAGTANVFARNLGYTNRVSSVLALLERGVVRRVDAGRVGRSLFLSSRAFGFTEAVKAAVAATPILARRRWRRHLEDWQTAVRSIARLPLPALTVDADGVRLAETAPMVLVANVGSSRGFLPLTPTASPFDGLLDAFVVRPMPKTSLVALLLGFLVQAPGRWRGVHYARATRVRVTAAEQPPQELCVVPGAVPVLTLPAVRSLGPRLRLAS